MSDDRPHPGDHVGALDGLRGLAALWVFFSHVQMLTGLRKLPLLSWGDSAVDLFMMISGFLMAHHYIGRAGVEPWHRPRTWAGFWVRRLFRIAPAYYLLLAAALAAGVWLGHDREVIGAHYPWTLTRGDRYLDHTIANVLTHVTFVFGAVPRFGFSTPLPDWSIGLEMQFYLVMPFLMLALGRRFWWPRALLLVIASTLLAAAVRGYSAQFDMPSFLPMKLGVFLIGMFCAYGVARRDLRAPTALVLVIVAQPDAGSQRGREQQVVRRRDPEQPPHPEARPSARAVPGLDIGPADVVVGHQETGDHHEQVDRGVAPGQQGKLAQAREHLDVREEHPQRRQPTQSVQGPHMIPGVGAVVTHSMSSSAMTHGHEREAHAIGVFQIGEQRSKRHARSSGSGRVAAPVSECYRDGRARRRVPQRPIDSHAP